MFQGVCIKIMVKVDGKVETDLGKSKGNTTSDMNIVLMVNTI